MAVTICALLGAQAGVHAASLGPLALYAPSVHDAFRHLEDGAAFDARGLAPTPASTLPHVAADMNEQVLRIPLGTPGKSLEATLFKPDGPGPFPLVIFNHGKNPGDAHDQARSRPLAFARAFVRHGYAVIAPDRQGFAGSDGTYSQLGCDVTDSARQQAGDVARTIAYMAHQPYVDAQRMVVAGTSHGGLISLAYGTEAAPGVRGILNFSGGLRQNACRDWQGKLVDAFGAYGEQARVPSLWLYGDNDAVWTPDLIGQLRHAYADHGAPLAFFDFGRYKDDAHQLVGDRDGVQVWWPRVSQFLAQLGLPTETRYAVAETPEPLASGFAPLDAIDAVPHLRDTGRAGYRAFLQQFPHRAFAVSAHGAWAWAEGGDDPLALALDRCRAQNAGSCQLYAVDERVVWRGDQPVPDTLPDSTDPLRALASR